MSLGLSSVTKRFGEQNAVDCVAAEISDGEFFVVLGPSGCGKSTLLRLIAGLERLDEGSIAIDGNVVSSADTHVPPEVRHFLVASVRSSSRTSATASFAGVAPDVGKPGALWLDALRVAASARSAQWEG